MICRPEIYRPLPPGMIPPAFLNSSNAPKADASVEDLIANGHFYAAAITSARKLANLMGNADLPTVFDLFYTRLACLSLINKTCLEIAAVESLELRDLTAAMYLDPLTNEHVVPWHLRVLAVRLQSIGFKDWRRGVMSYYMLAHDARTQIGKARADQDSEAEKMWEGRLHDLGIRVANMLVEMGDLEAAGRHLRTLDTSSLDTRQKKQITVMQVMVWLQIGDLRAAKRYLATMYPNLDLIKSPTLEAMNTSPANDGDDYAEKVLHALTAMAEGSFATALAEWTALQEVYPGDDMIAQNRAICLLYTGKMVEAKSNLEKTVGESEGVPYHSLLFNLCTFFELSSEKAREQKSGLVERIAEKRPGAQGWQRSGESFKLEALVGGVRA